MRKALQPAWYYLLSFTLLLLSLDVYAQSAARTLRLKGATVGSFSGFKVWSDSAKLNIPEQVLLQFGTALTPAQKDDLKKNGVIISDYISNNTYTATITPGFNKSITAGPIQYIDNVKLEWKTEPFLWQRINENLHNTVAVLVSFSGQVSADNIRAYIKQLGGNILPGNMERFGSYKVTIGGDQLLKLMDWYAVTYVSPISENIPLDREAKAASKVNLVAQPLSSGGYGLLGDGITIGIGDDVSGIYHVDLKDRILNFNPASMRHHGEHINGIVGGAGIIDPLAEGMAWHSQLINYQYDDILFNTPVMRQDHNMTVTNNSYVVLEGDCNYAGTYDAYSRFIDNLALQNNDVLHVFAAGNDGYLNCAPYPAGYGTTCGGYQPAKNELTVTSIDRSYIIAYDGSQGPVKDGRMKPDMCAIGVNVYSVIDTTSYEFASGTSMASPEVAGATGLLTERYKQLNGGANPRSDLLKILLMNGATDIGNPGPDYRYGFGALNLDHSVQMLNNHRYATNTITNGASQTLNINVPANTAQVKVMLYWHDVAASPMAANALVNDLDLEVKEPTGATHRPLVLDPSPANVTNNAVENADHLNNEEQVVISNPSPGNYTITIKGYNIPSGPQDYVVAYDFIPKASRITFPTTASQLVSDQNNFLYWDAALDSANGFNIDVSTDNGANWQSVAMYLVPNQHFYLWHPAGISSGKCKMRLTHGAETVTSNTFIITPQPVVRLDSIQCPGYMNINWDPVNNALAYQILRKVGPYMQPVDTVTASSYQFSGLSLDSTYYVAVAPIVDGLVGYRSLAVWRRPVDGTCANPVSHGDLAIDKILAPLSGRKLTSTQLGTNETLSLQLRNLYTTACSNYTVLYSINNGAWQSVTGLPSIPANSPITVNIPGLNLSTLGTYTIRAAVHNLTAADPVSHNDSATVSIVQLDNQLVNLSTTFTDGFETLPDTTLYRQNVGLASSSRWDYAHTTDSARLRTHVNDSVVISGSRSVSMDTYLNMPGNQNYLTGTFNFSVYNAASTEIRCEFDYIVHGLPKFTDGNQVWTRGSDTQPWVPIYNYDLSTLGQVSHSGTLSLTDAMLHNSQSYTSSFQLRFGQHDTSVIADRNYGNGVTIDNVKLYTVQNDVQLVKILTPASTECGLGNNSPLTVMVHNGVNLPQTNIHLYYQLDNGPIITETLNNIAAKDTVSYTFQQLMDLSASGTHTLSVWLNNAGDTYLANDSILNYTFHNQPLVTSFPYLQNFEMGDGYWYTNGTNDSWQYGTPVSSKIHKAASGTRAWKTNLTGNYNNLERSYLYSPCFDISALSDPMLSFSMAMDIENCGNTLCDGAWLEYSYDGYTWSSLGSAGQGTNWYDSSFQLWHDQGTARWHVASISLPASAQPLRLRFVFNSDPGATFEGLAIDDIHVFDRKYDIYDGHASVPAQQTVNSQSADFTNNGQLLTQLQSGSDLGNTTVNLYKHDTLINPGQNQYVLPRSFVVRSDHAPTDSVTLKLYILDSEVVQVINDTTCPSCSKPEDAYALGVSKYDAPGTSEENGSLLDNLSGTYWYYPYSSIAWVPYDQGYYAQFKTRSFSEFWFNNGGPTHSLDLATDYLVFHARKVNAQNALVDWISYIDTAVSTYWVQRSYDDSLFTDIAQMSARHLNILYYSYTDTPSVSIGSSVYYRLKWQMANSEIAYSAVRKIDWTDVNTLGSLYPNPTKGMFNVSWSANIGEQLQLSVSDIAGHTVYQNAYKATEWNNITTVHTPRFPDGIYIVRLSLAGRHREFKVLYY